MKFAKQIKVSMYEAMQKVLESLEFADSIDLQDLGLSFIDELFLDSDSFSANFIKQVGGNNFKHTWTKCNLIILSLIFKEILQVKDTHIREQFVWIYNDCASVLQDEYVKK